MSKDVRTTEGAGADRAPFVSRDTRVPRRHEDTPSGSLGGGLPDHPQPEERVGRPGGGPDPVRPQEELVRSTVEAATQDLVLRGLEEGGGDRDHREKDEPQEGGRQRNLRGPDEEQQHAAYERREHARPGHQEEEPVVGGLVGRESFAARGLLLRLAAGLPDPAAVPR